VVVDVTKGKLEQKVIHLRAGQKRQGNDDHDDVKFRCRTIAALSISTASSPLYRNMSAGTAASANVVATTKYMLANLLQNKGIEVKVRPAPFFFSRTPPLRVLLRTASARTRD